jgi:hypothetical protein
MTPVSSVRLRGLHDRFHPAATSRRAITLATAGASTGAVARRLLRHSVRGCSRIGGVRLVGFGSRAAAG